jgi:hypothetical protein
MKTQRITKILSLIMLVVAISVAGTVNVEANNHKMNRHHKVHTFKPIKKKPVRHFTKRKKCVNTPLDAGAILLLTGAGAAYVGIRRKQKK